MSGNPERKSAPAAANPSTQPANTDPRSRRTRDTLGDALVHLMGAKPFDDITVQNLLDRAGLSRSTFYAHFRDKQDLFLSDVEDFFEAASTLLARNNAPAHRIAPVQELFRHVAEVREFHSALLASGKWTEVRELGLGYFARSIEQRLTFAGTTLSPPELRPTAHALAGALFSLLEWWLQHSNKASPADMDALFHRLAQPSLPVAPGRKP